MGIVKERNPFLGMRGIRYLMGHEEIFLTQLRAILRAGAHGGAKILFPMVSGMSELRYARRLTRKAMDELRREGRDFDAEPQLGVMVEVPSLVMMADEVAREADFLSVGSNDLIQYTLAVDRAHEALHSLYQPCHPAVLRSLEITVEAAHRHGKPISICGEMAGDPLSLPLLLGLGFDRFSVSPYLVPEIKQSIRSLRYEECRSLATDALGLPDPKDVVDLIMSRLGSRFSDLLTMIRNSDGVSAEEPKGPVDRKGES
jgi:phosphotransferase system enzyme I (PtsI)